MWTFIQKSLIHFDEKNLKDGLITLHEMLVVIKTP